MNRRDLVAALGPSALGLAGCIDVPGSSEPTTPGDGATSPNGTATGGVDDGGPAVAFDALQPAVVRLQTDRLAVPASSSQYLYLTVGASTEDTGSAPAGDPPPREAFTLQFDGREFSPLGRDTPPLYRARTDHRYDATSGGGWLLFRLPETGTAEGTRLSGGGEWRPSSAVRERLAAPLPDLRVAPSFPDAVEVGAEPTLSVAVENEGSLPTRFVAGLSRSGPDVAMRPVALVSERVDAGAKTEITVTDDSAIGTVDDEEVGDGTGDLRYHLEWPGDSASADVEIVSPG